jgi:hypothetical protein
MHSKYKIEQTSDGTGYLLVDPDNHAGYTTGLGDDEGKHNVLGRYDTLVEAQAALAELENKDRYEYTLFEWADPDKYNKTDIDAVAQDVVLGLLAGKIVCSDCGAKHTRSKFTVGVTRWIGRDTPGEMSVDLECIAENPATEQVCGHGGIYTFNENPLFEKKLKEGAEEFSLLESIGWTKEKDRSGNYALEA